MVKFAVAARGKAADGRGSLAIELAWKLRSKPAAPPLEISSEPDLSASNDIPVDVVSAAEED